MCTMNNKLIDCLINSILSNPATFINQQILAVPVMSVYRGSTVLLYNEH